MRIHYQWIRTPDTTTLGPNTDPGALVQTGVQDPSDLGRCLCQIQATWVRCPFPAPSFLGLEGDAWPKLIIIITIIIDFTLKIKSMFFSIVIIFILILIILMNWIIFIILIIIFNLSTQVLIFLISFKTIYGRIHYQWVQTPDTTTLGPDTDPRALGQPGYKTQVIWVCAPSQPKQLGWGAPSHLISN